MSNLAIELHVLVALMDRRAESLLASNDVGLSYRRFLALLNVSELDAPTQRELAARLGSTEAATSRMVAGLARDGLLEIGHAPGNRRALTLTPLGRKRLSAATEVLGNSFDQLVRRLGNNPDHLRAIVGDLIAALRED